MRVILDTNVLLAALISPQGPPDVIFRAWRAAKFELVTSAVQLEELRRASRYPKLKAILPAHRVGTMVNNMQRAIVLSVLPALADGMELSDPNDAFLVAMALTSEADYLVTGYRRARLLQRSNANFGYRPRGSAEIPVYSTKGALGHGFDGYDYSAQVLGRGR